MMTRRMAAKAVQIASALLKTKLSVLSKQTVADALELSLTAAVRIRLAIPRVHAIVLGVGTRPLHAVFVLRLRVWLAANELPP